MLAKGARATRHISQSAAFSTYSSHVGLHMNVSMFLVKFLVVFSCECETCLVGLGKGGRNKAAADTARGGGFEQLGSLGVRVEKCSLRRACSGSGEIFGTSVSLGWR